MPAPAPAAARVHAPPISRWLPAAVVIVLLTLSVAVRVRNLSSPLTEDHSFRQTQTAMTVWTFVTEGIHPFAYQTPVLGPPWRVPLEFPIVQMVAALVVRAGQIDIDVACRLTNLVFFYLSAALLYALCRRQLESRGASVCILLAYVWMPFTIFWSRTSMIDYGSVAFALASLYGLSRWLERDQATALVAAIASACLAFLIKPTTQPTIAIAMIWLAWQRVRPLDLSRTWLRGRTRLLAGLLAALIVPMAVAVFWTRYADAVRQASPATAWLSAASLQSWNFGTWAQRTDWRNWSVILGRIQDTFLPGGYVLFALAGLWQAYRRRAAGGGFILAMAAGALAAVAIFFNLYCVHNYYLMAVSPALAIVAGSGFHWLCFEKLPPGRAPWALAILVLGVWQWNAQPYLARPYAVRYDSDFAYQVGRAIAEVTAPGDRVVVEGNDWSPDYLYYARRKGLMWRGSVVEMSEASLAALLNSEPFTAVVCVNRQSASARFWRQHTLAGQVGLVTIYRVSGPRQ